MSKTDKTTLVLKIPVTDFKDHMKSEAFNAEIDKRIRSVLEYVCPDSNVFSAAEMGGHGYCIHEVAETGQDSSYIEAFFYVD